MATTAPLTGYAPVNGLQMYYESHGEGEPLLLLHGSFMTIGLMGAIVPGLAEHRRVIAVELQGHGHTADIDRPITYENLADDCAALLRHLAIEQADVYGYSLGGGVALQLAIRHPERVRRLIVASASFASDGMHPESLPAIAQLTPEAFDGPWRDAYASVAPHPEAFPVFFEKLKGLDSTPYAWPAELVRRITAPTLIVLGDADVIRLEHVVDLFRLRGGGVFGDLAGPSAAHLAVLPGTTHLGMLERADWLLALIPPFLDREVAQPR